MIFWNYLLFSCADSNLQSSAPTIRIEFGIQTLPFHTLDYWDRVTIDINLKESNFPVDAIKVMFQRTKNSLIIISKTNFSSLSNITLVTKFIKFGSLKFCLSLLVYHCIHFLETTCSYDSWAIKIVLKELGILYRSYMTLSDCLFNLVEILDWNLCLQTYICMSADTNQISSCKLIKKSTSAI